MNFVDMFDIKTNPDLIKKLKEAAKIKMTKEEINEQRVSWVYGNLSKGNNMTEDEVRELLNEVY